MRQYSFASKAEKPVNESDLSDHQDSDAPVFCLIWCRFSIFFSRLGNEWMCERGENEKTADSWRKKSVAHFSYQTLFCLKWFTCLDKIAVLTHSRSFFFFLFSDLPHSPLPTFLLQQHYTDVYTKHTSVSVSPPSPWQQAGPVYFRRAPHTHFSFSPSPISPTCRLPKRRRDTERERKIVPQKNNRINSGCNPAGTSSKPLQSSRRRPAALLHYALCVRPQLV